jgi:superkiller protein 3
MTERPQRHRCIQIVLSMMISVAALGQSPHLAQGDSLLKLDKPQRALEAYEMALKEAPSAKAYLGRAKANLALNRNDPFLLDLERALRVDSTLAEAHYLRAVYALRGQDMPNAAVHADLAVQMSKEPKLTAQSRIVRGLASAELKMNEKAIEDLEAGLKAGIDDLDAMRTLARLYDASGRYEEALVLLEKLTTLEPHEVGHWSNRAFELIQLKRFDEALSMIEQALMLDKDEPVALSNRAYIYYHQQRDKEATQDVENSLRSYPTNAYALRTRALLRLRKGDRAKACEDLTLANVLANIPEVDQLVKEHCADQASPKKR